MVRIIRVNLCSSRHALLNLKPYVFPQFSHTVKCDDNIVRDYNLHFAFVNQKLRTKQVWKNSLGRGVVVKTFSGFQKFTLSDLLSCVTLQRSTQKNALKKYESSQSQNISVQIVLKSVHFITLSLSLFNFKTAICLDSLQMAKPTFRISIVFNN